MKAIVREIIAIAVFVSIILAFGVLTNKAEGAEPYQGISTFFGCADPSIIEQAQTNPDEDAGNLLIEGAMEAGVCIASPMPVPVPVTGVVKDIQSVCCGQITIFEFEVGGRFWYWSVDAELGEEIREHFRRQDAL